MCICHDMNSRVCFYVQINGLNLHKVIKYSTACSKIKDNLSLKFIYIFKDGFIDPTSLWRGCKEVMQCIQFILTDVLQVPIVLAVGKELREAGPPHLAPSPTKSYSL